MRLEGFSEPLEIKVVIEEQIEKISLIRPSDLYKNKYE